MRHVTVPQNNMSASVASSAVMDSLKAPLLPDQAVQVTADDEWLKGAVLDHPNLAWSSTCASLVGAAGLLEAVDLRDDTAKLQAAVRLSDGKVQDLKVQWLPLDALAELPEAESTELRAALAAPAPAEPREGDRQKSAERGSCSSRQSQEDQEWIAASGHQLPLDVVIVRLDGTEFVRSVSSLADRFEDFRKSVAVFLRKDASQVDLLLGETALPRVGAFRSIAESLAPGMRLQLLLRRRKLHPGAAKRLAKELWDYQREPSSFLIEPVEDPDFDGPGDKWSLVIPGPHESPYSGGVFKLNVQFPHDYPFKPPRIKFATPVWAPDVNPQTGEIDLDILGPSWSPALTVLRVAVGISGILEAPGKDGCGNPQAWKQRERSLSEFNQQAQDWTRQYALDDGSYFQGWEDVKLDFLVAGFARSGTHTLRGNLMEHPQVKFAEQEMTFNWAALPQQLQVWRYASFFKDEDEEPRRRLWGGKGEGLAASQRVIRLASKIPNLRLVVMVREPVEWLESLYNLRKFYLCQQPSTCSEVPSLEDVVLNGATFEDVNVEDAFLSKSLEHVVKFFPPSAGRSLLLEFELLRSRPRELFDQITSFLGGNLKKVSACIGTGSMWVSVAKASLVAAACLQETLCRARCRILRIVGDAPTTWKLQKPFRWRDRPAGNCKHAVAPEDAKLLSPCLVEVAELPFFVAELPEGKRLGNLIAVCTQIGNIAPIIYKALTRRRPGNLVCAIGFFQVVAVIALVACSLMWKSTPILLFCTVLAGSVGCMSSVTYWAAVAQRPASCVRGMSVGMTLGGLLATGFAAMQLAGCDQKSPRFGPAAFFILAAVIQAGQGGAFAAKSCGQTSSQNGHAAAENGTSPAECETAKPPIPRIAKFLMAGCFVVYATTYTMPTLMPFMAGHFTSTTESQQLLLWMQVLQNSGDVLGRLATALVHGNKIVFCTWMLLLTASFTLCVVTAVCNTSLWFSYSFAVLLLPLICGLFYFSRGLLVTIMYLYARGLGQQRMVQEITENMGFCGQMGALIANLAAFVLVRHVRKLFARHEHSGTAVYEELGLSVSLCSEHLRPSLATLKERLARPAQAQSTDRDLTAGLQGERVHSLGGFACAGDVRAAYMRLLSAWNPDPADPASIELFSCPVCKEVWAHKHQEDRCPVLATPADLAMIEYHHGRWGMQVLCKLRGSVVPKALIWSVPCSVLTVFIHIWWRDAMQEYFENSSGLDSIWSGYTFILGFLIVFRSNQAYSRFWESVSLTHKIRGEWTSAFSSLLGFCTKSAEREADVSHFREYLLRLMSLLHCYALHEVAELSDETNIEVVDLAGLSSESIEYLHASPDRCETVMLWIERLIVESEKQKLFDVAPPVLSRAFQELSDGMVNVAELRKIVEVPFPFPYSQYLSFMLVLHWIVSPLVAVQLISEWSWAGGTVWLISTSYWTLFYIAQEIDQPFGQDYNDLPVVEIQQRFNQSLLHLASPESYILPDFIAHVAQRRTVCMRTSRTTLRASAILVAPEPQPETSLVDVVVEQDEASSTHLAEVLDEPAADIVLVSPHIEKTILGPRAVELVTRRGFSTGEPMQLQQHKSILRELAPPAWSAEDLDSFVDLVAAQKQLTEAREAPVATAELKISLVELTICFRDLASKARRNSAELQEETLRARAAEQADKLLALTQLLTGTSRRPGQENDEPFSVQST
eukprot:s2467_g7.t2